MHQKGFQFGTVRHIISHNPKTKDFYGDMDPSTPIVCNIVILWSDPPPSKTVINCNTLAGPPSPYK